MFKVSVKHTTVIVSQILIAVMNPNYTAMSLKGNVKSFSKRDIAATQVRTYVAKDWHVLEMDTSLHTPVNQTAQWNWGYVITSCVVDSVAFHAIARAIRVFLRHV